MTTQRISRAAWRTSELGYNKPGYKHTELRSLFYDRSMLMVRAALLTRCPDVDAVNLMMESINIENSLQKEIINARLNLRPFRFDEQQICKPSYAAAILDFYEIWTTYINMDYDTKTEPATLLAQIYTGKYNYYEDDRCLDKLVESLAYLDCSINIRRLDIIRDICKDRIGALMYGAHTYKNETYGQIFRGIVDYNPGLNFSSSYYNRCRNSAIIKNFYIMRPDTYIDDSPDSDIGPFYGPEPNIKIISIAQRQEIELEKIRQEAIRKQNEDYYKQIDAERKLIEEEEENASALASRIFFMLFE